MNTNNNINLVNYILLYLIFYKIITSLIII